MLCEMLKAAGAHPLDFGRVGPHSLQATNRSWCTKFGVPTEMLRALGYHHKLGDRMPIEFSRDAIAIPMEWMVKVCDAVSTGAFLPDATRWKTA